MKAVNIVSSLCLVALIAGSFAAKLPNYIHICKQSDPHVTKCVRDAIEVLKPKLKVGIPELKVPGLEPLFIKEIVIFPGGGSSNFKAFLKNINVYGVSDFQVTKLKLDLSKYNFRVGIKIPVLRLEGDYDVDARILVAPIKGTGKFNANVTNVEGQGVLKADILKRPDGTRMMKFTSFDLAIRFDDYNVHLDNLFSGDEILSRAANDILNENKQDFIPVAIPFIQRKVSEIVLEIANGITDELDVDEAFPA